MSKLVLVVDDEALIALDIADTVESSGCRVLGPAFSLSEAGALIDTQTPEVALLDIDVAGMLVWPLARRLKQMGCRPVFVSANHTHEELRSEFADCLSVDKPASGADILQVLNVSVAA